MTALIQTNRQLAIHANRQAVMQAILHRLRRDMAVASAVETSVSPDTATVPGPGPEPVATEESVESVRISTAKGTIQYRLETRLLIDRRPGSVSLPPEQTLSRIDVDGAERTWTLGGQVMELAVPTDGGARLLQVAIESLTIHATGPRRLRRFETTLCAGMAP
jgi:hypothetical protein